MRNLNLLLSALCLVGPMVSSSAAQTRAEILWTRPICVETNRYIGWPTVCRLKNGDILAVFSGDRDWHVCPWGKVQMVRSTDGGETWGPPKTIASTILDDRDAGIVQMPDGEVVVTWFTSIAYRRPDLLKAHDDFRRHDEKMDKVAAKAAADAGVDWISSVAPVYFGQNFPSAMRHYKAISEATDLPFLVYAFKSTLVPERDVRLFGLKNVKGIKYTGRDFYACQRLRRMLDKETVWFAGCDELLVSALALGDTFSGGIGLNYNIIPRHFAKICELCARNDFRSAAKWQAEVNRLVDLVLDSFADNWSAFKVLMKGVGIDCGYCRAPYAPLTKRREKECLARFVALKLS